MDGRQPEKKFDADAGDNEGEVDVRAVEGAKLKLKAAVDQPIRERLGPPHTSHTCPSIHLVQQQKQQQRRGVLDSSTVRRHASFQGRGSCRINISARGCLYHQSLDTYRLSEAGYIGAASLRYDSRA